MSKLLRKTTELLIAVAVFMVSLVSTSCQMDTLDEPASYALKNGYWSFSVGALNSAPSRSASSTNRVFVTPYKSDIAWWGATGWAFCNGIYLMDGYDYMIQGTEAGKKVLVPGKYLTGSVTDSIDGLNAEFLKWDEDNHLNSLVVNGDVWNASNSDGIWYNDRISWLSIIVYPWKSGNSKIPTDLKFVGTDDNGEIYSSESTNANRIYKNYDANGNVYSYEFNYKVDYYYMTFFLDLDKEGSGYERGRIW